MSSESNSKNDWEFTAAIELIRSIERASNTKNGFIAGLSGPSSSSAHASSKGNNTDPQSHLGLGDFDLLFAALGFPQKESNDGSKVLSTVLALTEPEVHKTQSDLGRIRDSPKTVGSIGKALAASKGVVESRNKNEATKIANNVLENQEEDVKGLTASTEQRLVHSEGEYMEKKSNESQIRRQIIQSVIGKSPIPTSARPEEASPLRYTHLRPASIGPTNLPRVKSEDKLFIKRTLNMDRSAERSVALLNLLCIAFPEDEATLSHLIPWSIPLMPDTNGIHVFVDISNILIGFHDTLKAHRNIPKETRINRERLSFSNFALILERGRPVAKRVLVGSDRLESIMEAKYIGYETHILERVAKYKESTSRQKFRRKNGYGLSSGSDDNQTMQVRRVEQGVDEILHLKMSQSLLDSDAPSTIVLATGDAAEAEYSDGFLRMVERALSRNWKVEIVAFKENLSGAYRNNPRVAQWGDKFRVIELDSCAELIRRD